MDWMQSVYNYCERGSDPGLMAEPVNALTNAAFFIAAGLAYRHLLRQPSATRDTDCKIFIGFVVAMGVGSTLFHLFAQRWAMAADIGAIALFVLVYLNYALNRFLDLTPAVSFLLTVAFLGTIPSILVLPGGFKLLNGTIAFVPAWICLIVVGWLSHARGHPAGRPLLIGAAIFFVSIAFRAADQALCSMTEVAGIAVGTHAMWHVLNAVLLYLLVRAAIDHGRHNANTYEVLPPTGPGGERE